MKVNLLNQEYKKQYPFALSRSDSMKVLAALFCRANRVLHPQKDFYNLFLILCLSVLIHSLAELAQELPDLVESIVKLLGVV
jgi:hypothetical protein